MSALPAAEDPHTELAVMFHAAVVAKVVVTAVGAEVGTRAGVAGVEVKPKEMPWPMIDAVDAAPICKIVNSASNQNGNGPAPGVPDAPAIIGVPPVPFNAAPMVNVVEPELAIEPHARKRNRVPMLTELAGMNGRGAGERMAVVVVKVLTEAGATLRSFQFWS